MAFSLLEMFWTSPLSLSVRSVVVLKSEFIPQPSPSPLPPTALLLALTPV